MVAIASASIRSSAVPEWVRPWIGNFIFWYLALALLFAMSGVGYELGLRAPTEVGAWR